MDIRRQHPNKTRPASSQSKAKLILPISGKHDAMNPAPAHLPLQAQPSQDNQQNLLVLPRVTKPTREHTAPTHLTAHAGPEASTNNPVGS